MRKEREMKKTVIAEKSSKGVSDVDFEDDIHVDVIVSSDGKSCVNTNDYPQLVKHNEVVSDDFTTTISVLFLSITMAWWLTISKMLKNHKQSLLQSESDPQSPRRKSVTISDEVDIQNSDIPLETLDSLPSQETTENTDIKEVRKVVSTLSLESLPIEETVSEVNRTEIAEKNPVATVAKSPLEASISEVREEVRNISKLIKSKNNTQIQKNLKLEKEKNDKECIQFFCMSPSLSDDGEEEDRFDTDDTTDVIVPDYSLDNTNCTSLSTFSSPEKIKPTSLNQNQIQNQMSKKSNNSNTVKFNVSSPTPNIDSSDSPEKVSSTITPTSKHFELTPNSTVAEPSRTISKSGEGGIGGMRGKKARRITMC